MADITPGSTVTVKVVKEPNSASARKTLVRLLSKDPAVIKENKRLKSVRARNAVLTTRGGRYRLWSGRVVKQHPVAGDVGEAGTILASVDVLTDLQSVAQFVEVSAA